MPTITPGKASFDVQIIGSHMTLLVNPSLGTASSNVTQNNKYHLTQAHC